MRVEVLTVPDCPNGPVVEQRLAEALAEALAGRTSDVTTVERRVVESGEQAALYGMHGSPTVLIDGRDPFATPGDSTGPSLSCRLYRDEQGRVQGAPSVGQLIAALRGTECCAEEAPAAEEAVSAAAAVGRGGRGRLAPVEGGLRAVHQAVLRSFAAVGRAPEPSALEEVAEPLGVSASDVLAHLAAEDFLTLDGDGRIAAAYPFSAAATGIEVTLPNGVTVSSMCAIDALGIPSMLRSDAVIEAADPVTGEAVRVAFRGGSAQWQPASAVVFYGARAEAGPSAAVCCGYLRFFAARESAEAFAAAHPEATGRILAQDEARVLGEEIFGPCLAASA